MKKLALVIGLGCVSCAQATHMDLNSNTKCVFAQKRLKMMKAHLHTSKEELVLLEESLTSLPAEEIEHFPLRKTRIAELRKEVIEIETSIPIMEKSLHALCATLK